MKIKFRLMKIIENAIKLKSKVMMIIDTIINKIIKIKSKVIKVKY